MDTVSDQLQPIAIRHQQAFAGLGARAPDQLAARVDPADAGIHGANGLVYVGEHGGFELDEAVEEGCHCGSRF